MTCWHADTTFFVSPVELVHGFSVEMLVDSGLLSCRATRGPGQGTRLPYRSVQTDETDLNYTSPSH